MRARAGCLPPGARRRDIPARRRGSHPPVSPPAARVSIARNLPRGSSVYSGSPGPPRTAVIFRSPYSLLASATVKLQSIFLLIEAGVDGLRGNALRTALSTVGVV